MTDRELIEALGGPAKLARLLGYAAEGGVQRVHNWMTRGIPPRVRLEHAAIFQAVVDLADSHDVHRPAPARAA